MEIRDINYSADATAQLIKTAKTLNIFTPQSEDNGYRFAIALTDKFGSTDFFVRFDLPTTHQYRQLLREELAKQCNGRKTHFIGETFNREIPDAVKRAFNMA